jgi:hypothetical protein
MISMREALLLNGGEPSAEASMDLLAGAAGKVSQPPSRPTVTIVTIYGQPDVV